MHPIVRAAGRDTELPDWARCSAERRGHLERTADLVDEWAEVRGLDSGDRLRWRAAAVLHDALRDAELEELESWVDDRDWPPPTLHGPACAARLASEGVEDGPLLRAVAYHTSGHPDFDPLGDHLYLADYLEPGRDFRLEERRDLRKRVVEEPRRVLLSVIRSRMEHLLTVPRAILPETVAYWNSRLEGGVADAAGRASG